jgi:uncharacterized membrane protein YbhN (UPF0104 family)
VNRRRRAAARVALAALLLGGLLWWVDPRTLLHVVAGADPRWLALGLLSAVAANLVSALRWWVLARWLGAAVHAGWATAMYFGGVAINALLPGAVVGGDLYRAHALARHGLPWLESGVSVLFDRLSGLWMLVVLGAVAAAVGTAGLGADRALAALGLGGAAPAALLLLAVAGLVVPGLVLLLWRHGVALPRGVQATAGRWPQRLATIVHRPRLLSQYGWQVLTSTAVQVLSVGTLACGGAALGVELPPWAWAVVAVPVFLMAALPVSFGGWGTREAAAALSLGAFGVAPVQAVAVAMLYGLAALVQAIGGVVLLVRQRGGDLRTPRD